MFCDFAWQFYFYFLNLLFGLGKCSFWLLSWQFFPRALKTTIFTNSHRPHSVFTDFQGLEKPILFSPNSQRPSKTVRTLCVCWCVCVWARARVWMHECVSVCVSVPARAHMWKQQKRPLPSTADSNLSRHCHWQPKDCTNSVTPLKVTDSAHNTHTIPVTIKNTTRPAVTAPNSDTTSSVTEHRTLNPLTHRC